MLRTKSLRGPELISWLGTARHEAIASFRSVYARGRYGGPQEVLTPRIPENRRVFGQKRWPEGKIHPRQKVPTTILSARPAVGAHSGASLQAGGFCSSSLFDYEKDYDYEYDYEHEHVKPQQRIYLDTGTS